MDMVSRVLIPLQIQNALITQLIPMVRSDGWHDSISIRPRFTGPESVEYASNQYPYTRSSAPLGTVDIPTGGPFNIIDRLSFALANSSVTPTTGHCHRSGLSELEHLLRQSWRRLSSSNSLTTTRFSR